MNLFSPTKVLPWFLTNEKFVFFFKLLKLKIFGENKILTFLVLKFRFLNLIFLNLIIGSSDAYMNFFPKNCFTKLFLELKFSSVFKFIKKLGPNSGSTTKNGSGKVTKGLRLNIFWYVHTSLSETNGTVKSLVANTGGSIA